MSQYIRSSRISSEHSVTPENQFNHHTLISNTLKKMIADMKAIQLEEQRLRQTDSGKKRHNKLKTRYNSLNNLNSSFRSAARTPQMSKHNAIKLKPSQNLESFQLSRMSVVNKTPANVYNQQRIYRDIEKNLKLYQILCCELGLTQQEVFKLNPSVKRYYLDRFTRQKGLQYLHHTKSFLKFPQRRPQSFKKNMQSQKSFRLSEKKKTIDKDYKGHLNTQRSSVNLPEEELKNTQETNAFPQKLKQSKKKFDSSLKKTKLVTEQSQRKPLLPEIPLSIRAKRNLEKSINLKEKQQMLGKIVFDKVKRHFANQKKKNHPYYACVQSEQTIDNYFVKFLQTKINRAEKTFNLSFGKNQKKK